MHGCVPGLWVCLGLVSVANGAWSFQKTHYCEHTTPVRRGGPTSGSECLDISSWKPPSGGTLGETLVEQSCEAPDA